MESRWLRWIGPGLIALVGIVSITSVTATAAQRPWTPPACSDSGDERVAAARAAGPATLGDVAGEAWFRLDPKLDRAGALVGQRLAVGLDGERGSRIVDLPPESFAAGPFGRIVLVGSDDGSRSALRAIDVAGQCAWDLGEERDVIRRATIDPDGLVVYETRVARTTRADLGTWSRPFDGSQTPTQIVDPIDADERFGRTFSTEFTWDLEGKRLAIQSCGEVACRTRVLEPGGGPPQLVDLPDLGALVGVDGDSLVTYAACPGQPCPVVATDLATGSRAQLAEAAAIAVLVPTPDGARLVHEVLVDAGVALRSVALDGSSGVDLGAIPDGLRLQATPEATRASSRNRSGWVLLSPDGRVPDTGPDARTLLRRATDGLTVQLEETAR